MESVIAIDPGASGGLAFRHKDGTVDAVKMPATPAEVADLLRSFRASEGVSCRAVIEKVGGFIQGSARPGSTMFNFGYGYGYTMCALQMLGIPTVVVTPQKWQKWLGMGTKKQVADANDQKSAWKNKLKAEAERRYPSIKVTLYNADALLMLSWALSAKEARP